MCVCVLCLVVKCFLVLSDVIVKINAIMFIVVRACPSLLFAIDYVSGYFIESL